MMNLQKISVQKIYNNLKLITKQINDEFKNSLKNYYKKENFGAN